MSDWIEKRLGDIADTTSGGTPDRKNPNYYGGTIPWVKSGELEDSFISETDEQLTLEGLKNSSAKIFPGGTLLMAMYGATVGKTAILEIPAATNQAVCAIFPRNGYASTDFVRYALIHQRPEILKQRYGGAQPNISQQIIRNLTIPVPPLSEQRKIAAVLGLVQRAIEQQERLIALTTELKTTLLHKLFTEGLRGEPQKQTEIGPVPESWTILRLEDVCTFLSGGTPSKNKPEFWTGSIPWVSPKDMKMPRLNGVADHISDAALEDGSSLASAGSVFVVIRGMILAKDVPVALAEVPMAFNQDMKAIIPGPRILSAFLLYALVAFKRNLFQKVGRSSHGTMTLMSSELAKFLIPLPDIQIQEQIATAIETVEHKHDAHRRKHAALTALFRALLHQLMTAQIRVNDLDLTELAERIDEQGASPGIADD
jgi:type I restriction enzyme, S subunit